MAGNRIDSAVEFLLIVSIIAVVVPPSTCNPTIKNVKLEVLITQFGEFRVEMEELKAENVKLNSDVKYLKSQISTQDEEMKLLKNKISEFESTKWMSQYNAATTAHEKSSNYQTNDEAVIIANYPPPSSCLDLRKAGHFAHGFYLVKNNQTNDIETVYCHFVAANNTYQELAGIVDVKTEKVHFYVTRNTTFIASDSTIPYELARLNLGEAMDLSSGIFTAPVAGIYHFEFSAVKSPSFPLSSYSSALVIYLQVNGVNVGIAATSPGSTGSYDSLSSSASLQLEANDTVNLFNANGGSLYDEPTSHWTHFSGWLVEEDL